MTNFSWFALFICEDLLLLLSFDELNISGFERVGKTKQDIYKCPFENIVGRLINRPKEIIISSRYGWVM